MTWNFIDVGTNMTSDYDSSKFSILLSPCSRQSAMFQPTYVLPRNLMMDSGSCMPEFKVKVQHEMWSMSVGQQVVGQSVRPKAAKYFGEGKGHNCVFGRS